MPPQTITNASNVPIETNSPKIPIGNKPATIIATEPVKIVVTYGVLNFGCTLLKDAGNSPSLDIEKKILGCPINITKITELKPAIAPTLINGLNHFSPSPAVSTATAIGAIPRVFAPPNVGGLSSN